MDISEKRLGVFFSVDSALDKIIKTYSNVKTSKTLLKQHEKNCREMITFFFRKLEGENKIIEKIYTKVEKHEGIFAFKRMSDGTTFHKLDSNLADLKVSTITLSRRRSLLNQNRASMESNSDNGTILSSTSNRVTSGLMEERRRIEIYKNYMKMVYTEIQNPSYVRSTKVVEQIKKEAITTLMKEYKDTCINSKQILLLMLEDITRISLCFPQGSTMVAFYNYLVEYTDMIIEQRKFLGVLMTNLVLLSKEDAKEQIETDITVFI